jgi:hypothetical protein
MKPEQVNEVMIQMKEGKSYIDIDYDFQYGEERTYYYDKEKQSFAVDKVDSIVASYYKVEDLTELQMIDYLLEIHVDAFIGQGFIFR